MISGERKEERRNEKERVQVRIYKAFTTKTQADKYYNLRNTNISIMTFYY